MRIVGGKPQAAKRNSHLDHEAFFRDLCLGVEDGVEREIELLAFGPESVGLDSQGIGKKGIGPAMIVERVQHQLDIVIVKHVFPPRKMGANLVRLIVEADEDDVQVLVVIAEVGLGTLRDRLSVTGSALDELVDLGHLALPCRTRFHLQEIFQARGDC